MWKVKYINLKTRQVEYRTYRKPEYIVRQIAENMKDMVYTSMWRCDQ